MAHSGPTAVRQATDWRPDVILCDIGLPGMSGHEVARRLRERPDMRHVVLVAMTGFGQDADRERSREAGFDHHFVKPVDPQQLAGFLQTAAAKRDHPAGGSGATSG